MPPPTSLTRLSLLTSLLVSGCGRPARADEAPPTPAGGTHTGATTGAALHATAAGAESRHDFPPVGERVTVDDAEWRRRLTPAQYEVLREAGTEAPFSGIYNDHDAPGVYVCAGCGAPLFSSEAKFECGTGWPAFSSAIEAGRILTSTDERFGMVRTALTCARCGGHLGHVFDDGPPPTGQRFCVDSLALDFVPD
jgi:peptide-methionine (R)-S-oxide reductase